MAQKEDAGVITFDFTIFFDESTQQLNEINVEQVPDNDSLQLVSNLKEEQTQKQMKCMIQILLQTTMV